MICDLWNACMFVYEIDRSIDRFRSQLTVDRLYFNDRSITVENEDFTSSYAKIAFKNDLKMQFVFAFIVSFNNYKIYYNM